MVRQTVFGFKLERTEETLTAQGGLALLAEFNHGLGVCGLADRYLPGPGSNRGYAPSVFVDRLILMLQGGGRSLEDLRELRREAGVLRLLGREAMPDPDTLGELAAADGGSADGASRARGAGAGAGRPDCPHLVTRWARDLHVGCGCHAGGRREAGRALELSGRARVHAAAGVSV